MKNSNSILLFGSSALVSCLIFASSAHAVAEVSSRPILFVHGFSPLALPEDCHGIWGSVESELSAKGFTGQMTTVGYYGDDLNCDLKPNKKDSILTSIPDLAEHFAWSLYNGWSSQNVHVDVVAHSLGGLIVRYALYKAAAKDPAYPPYLIVDHVVSMGAPYTGYSPLAFSCYLNPANVQCWEMAPYSSFIKELATAAAQLPQGLGGTVWSNIGSDADVVDSSDGVVGSASATSMPIPSSSKTIIPWYKLVFHTNYYHKSFVTDLAATGLLKSATSDAAEAELSMAPAVESETDCPSVMSAPSSLAAAKLARQDLPTDFSKLPICHRPGRLAPNEINGEERGVSVTQVLAGGLFDRMGLQNGDVVQGCTADTINEAFDAIGSLAAGSGNQLTFCVIRNGQSTTRHFSF